MPSAIQPTMRGDFMIFIDAYKSLSKEMSLCMTSFKNSKMFPIEGFFLVPIVGMYVVCVFGTCFACKFGYTICLAEWMAKEMWVTY